MCRFPCPTFVLSFRYSDISVTAKVYTQIVDEVFEQNRKK